MARKGKYKTNDQIADRLVLLLSNVDSFVEGSGPWVGALHEVALHAHEYQAQIVAGLRKKANY